MVSCRCCCRVSSRANSSADRLTRRRRRPAQANLALTPAEADWLRARCPFFKEDYLTYLANFRFNPAKQVSIDFVADDDSSAQAGTEASSSQFGRFEISIKGNWAETILWEVPLMAIISEAYFTVVDTKWDYVGQFGQSSVLCGEARRAER